MPSLMQQLLPEPANESPILSARVLVVSADVRLYAAVLSAVNSKVWEVDWARSLEAAIEICASGNIPIILYDENLPWSDWRKAFDRLCNVPNRLRLLLAANAVDEPLWRTVLMHHGYDVVARAADSLQLKRAVRFAWLSLHAASTDPLSIKG